MKVLLPDVRESDESDVGNQLELEVQPELLSDLGLLSEGGCPPAVGQETRHFPVRRCRLERRGPGARRDSDRDDRCSVEARGRWCPTGTFTSRSAPLAPRFCFPLPCAPSSARRCGWSLNPSSDDEPGRGDQPNVSALATVPAVGAAHGDVGLAPERDRPRAAVAGFHVELCLVYEARHWANATSLRYATGSRPRGSVARSDHVYEAPALAAAEFHVTLGKCEQGVVAAPPDIVHRGGNRVPRWRTMMDPAETVVPSKTLTPRRCARESRPLRVEPPPLVLDIVSS